MLLLGRPFTEGIPGSGRSLSETSDAGMKAQCLFLQRRGYVGNKWISTTLKNYFKIPFFVIFNSISYSVNISLSYFGFIVI